jgi:hypothetical protein
VFSGGPKSPPATGAIGLRFADDEDTCRWCTVLGENDRSDDILLFNSYTPLVYERRLRQAGFRIVLLDVTDEELLRRHAQRLAEEGWTNVQWFETSKATIEELRATGWIDHTISGSAPPHRIASTLLRVHSAPASPSS